MTANTDASRSVTLSFRTSESTRRMLESIQLRRDHQQLSDTLREAIRDYIKQSLREQGEAA